MVRRRGSFFLGCILERVRGAVLFATVGSALVVASQASADWEIRRSGTHDLTERAARAFAEKPSDADLARHLLNLAGKARRAELLAQFCADAQAPAAHADRVLGCATLLFALGSDDAATMFARAAALQPTLAAFEGEGRALARAGRKEEARARHEQALALARRPTDERRLLEAVLGLDDGDPARELVLVERLAALDPRNGALVERQVDLLEKLGRPGRAADALEAFGAHAREDERFGFALRAAQLRDAAGEGERAAAALAALLARTPRGATERRRLAWDRAVEIARHREALPALASELARAPGALEWDVLAQVRDELGDLEGALAAALRAARGKPGPELGQRIVGLLERLGRNAEVASTYETFARAEPSQSTWPLALVEHELRQGRRRSAGEHLDAAAARFGRDAVALGHFAELAARWGEDGRALTLWERICRLRPGDERALRGLAEAQLASGQRALALRTWQRLRDHDPSRVDGQLRLAEVLLEHDFVDEARAQLPPVEGGLARSTRAHRLLAQILERQGQADEAVRAWEAVLALSDGAARSGERREARARILALLVRGNRARLEAWLRTLAEDVRKDPTNREQALFLAEAQQRVSNDAGAMTTLRAILDADAARPGVGAALVEDSTADVTFALARLLRARGALAEAAQRLDEIVRRFPSRAREAHVLMADLGLARHDDGAALAHAEEAARLAPRDGEALARVAAIEERAGRESSASETYRRAFALDADGPAGLALARLLARSGDAEASSEILHRLLQTSTDEDVLVEAGRSAIAVDEYLGRLPELERVVAGASYASPRAPTIRRVRGDVLRRLVPPLYRAAATDTAARDELVRLGKHATGTLLGLVTEAGAAPDRADVELLGMLGNADATPVLARLAAPPADPAREDAPDGPAIPKDAQVAAVIALGRLGDPRGHDALSDLVSAPEARLRAAAVWALGRMGDARDAPALARALRDARADVAALAGLGLGRLRTSRAVALLVSAAQDAERPLAVRRAALAGLGLSHDRVATPDLITLVASGDAGLEAGALAALGATRDTRALPLLLARAALGDPLAPATDVSLAALENWSTERALLDEATAIESDRIDGDAAVAALWAPAPRERGMGVSVPHPVNSISWPAWRHELGIIVEGALAAGHGHRAQTLAALDARDDGLSLGALWPPDAPALTPEIAAALQTLAARIRDRLGALLDDPDLITRAHALRLLAKLDDDRVTPARVMVAAQGAPPMRVAALFCARRWAARSPASASALARALSEAATRTPPPEWPSRLGLIEILAALGEPATSALTRALSDTSPFVRDAARAALATRATDAHLPRKREPTDAP
jgi:tetratricopeptide (TPR) repeat protein